MGIIKKITTVKGESLEYFKISEIRINNQVLVYLDSYVNKEYRDINVENKINSKGYIILKENIDFSKDIYIECYNNLMSLEEFENSQKL